MSLKERLLEMFQTHPRELNQAYSKSKFITKNFLMCWYVFFPWCPFLVVKTLQSTGHIEWMRQIAQ
jgi:hypothetical protein